jgi:membrane protein
MLRALKQTVQEWLEDNAPTWSAAIAFYTLFSLAPIMLVVVGVAGLVWEREAVRSEVVAQFEMLVGQEGAAQVAGVLDRMYQPGGTVWATALGGAAVLVGATAVFNTLRSALNRIWNVEAPPFSLRSLLRHRLLSFAMVLCLAFLLLVSLLVSAALAAAGRWSAGWLPVPASVLEGLNIGVSWLVFTFLFAAILKWLPDAWIRWREVWVGAGITSLLFALGKFAIGFYLGRSGAASVYGAAGSLAIFLLWIDYSAMIFLLGAEFTQVYARTWGTDIRPDRRQKHDGQSGPDDSPGG